MDINTSTDIEFEIDDDDLGYLIRPIVEVEIENADIASLVSDEVRHNGAESIDIEHEAQQLLRQYANGHGPTGDHDDTGCTTAKLFETAVYNANSRLANSEQGSAIVAGVVSTDLATEVRRLTEQVAAIQRALNALPAAIIPSLG